MSKTNMESISYITCTNNKDLLNKCLLRSLELEHEDELIVVESPESIALGYNCGIDKAKHKIKCFIHHDIIVSNSTALRMNLMSYCTSNIGIVGVIGSTTDTTPWWEGNGIGNVIDSRMGIIYFGEGNGYCQHLDGIVLATAQEVRFDEDIPGFHLYDQDICKQMTSKGLKNFCLKDGFRLVTHYTGAPSSIVQINGYADALDSYRKKWA
jgi:hypothetical protein